MLDRDSIYNNLLDRVDRLEERIEDLRDVSRPSETVIVEQPEWQALAGWISTGSVLQDVTGKIVLDPAIPRIQIGADGYIESADFSTGVSGFQINGGTAEFNDVVIRGTIYAVLGEIGGWDIGTYTLSADSGAVGLNSEATAGNDIRIWAGHATPTSAPFQVFEDGSLIASDATITGTINATLGAIGGWVIGTYTLTADGGAVGLNSEATGGTDIRIWAGHATPGSAPFRVDEDGALVASDADITGTIDANAGHLGDLDVDGTVTVGAAAPYIEIDGPNKRLVSSNFVTDSTGFVIDADGNAEFNNISARGELRSAFFAFNEQAATAGTMVIAQNAGKLRSAMTTVAAPATFSMEIEDPASGHSATFAANDVVRIKDGGDDAWMTIDAVTDQGTYYEYTCTLEHGTEGTFPAGGVVVDYGQSGDAVILLTADAINAPYMRMYTHAGSPWSAVTTRLRLGNLNGDYGYSSEIYGFAAGRYAASYANVTLDDTNGLCMRSYETTKIVIQPDGDVFIGADVSAAATTNLAIFTNAQTYNGEAVGAGDLLIGDNTVGAANILWDLSEGQLKFRGGTTTQFYIDTDGTLVAGADAVYINDDGIGIEMDASYNTNRAYHFLEGGTEYSGVYARSFNGNWINVWAKPVAGSHSIVALTAEAAATQYAQIYFYTSVAGAGGSKNVWLDNVAGVLTVYNDGKLHNVGDVSTGGGLVVGTYGGTTSAGWILVTGGLDLNGLADALVLDADGDTSISAPADDEIDIEVGGADVAEWKAGGLYEAAGAELFPNADGRGLAARLVNPLGLTAWTAHFRAGETTGPGNGSLAAYAWQGAPLGGTPTNVLYNFNNDYLHTVGATSTKYFMSTPITNAAASWQNLFIAARLTTGAATELGLRIDNGGNEYVELYVTGTLANATIRVDWRYSDPGAPSGGTPVVVSSGLIVPAGTMLILRLYAYWSGATYSAYGYVIGESGSTVNITGFTRLLTSNWTSGPPVAGRVGVFTNLGASPGNYADMDWFYNTFT